MRGLGTIFRQKGSRYLWMQYFVAGERRRESTGCEKLKDAKDVLARKIIEIRQEREHAGTAPATIAGLFKLLEADYEINGRKSLPHLRGSWKKHLSPHFSGIPTNKLTADQVDDYIRKRQGAGASNATVNRELAALKRMYKIALKAGRLKSTPYIGLLKERNVRKGFLRDAEYQALTAAAESKGLWLRAMFELGYTYGWRKTELAGMRVSQVDLAAGTIELNPGETKNDEGRIVEMTARIRELLTRCLEGKKPDDLVITRPTGKPAGNFRRTWSSACRTAGVPGLLFHDLRRTAVRNMRRDGISEKIAMRISGHKTRAVFERYNIVDQADLKEAAVKQEKGAERRTRAEQGSEGRRPPEGAESTRNGLSAAV